MNNKIPEEVQSYIMDHLIDGDSVILTLGVDSYGAIARKKYSPGDIVDLYQWYDNGKVQHMTLDGGFLHTVKNTLMEFV